MRKACLTYLDFQTLIPALKPGLVENVQGFCFVSIITPTLHLICLRYENQYMYIICLRNELKIYMYINTQLALNNPNIRWSLNTVDFCHKFFSKRHMTKE